MPYYKISKTDFAKILLMLKLTQGKVEAKNDLKLFNLWRVSSAILGRLLRQNNCEIVDGKQGPKVIEKEQEEE